VGSTSPAPTGSRSAIVTTQLRTRPSVALGPRPEAEEQTMPTGDGRAGASPDAANVDAAVKLRRIRLIVALVLVGTVTSIGFHYMGTFWFHWDYPKSTFLFWPKDHLNDWDSTYLWTKALVHGEPGGAYIYFPFAGLVTAVATLLPMKISLGIVMLVFLGVLALMLSRWVVNLEESVLLRIQQVFILIMLSYPVLFTLDRGNQEMIVFALLAGFLYFYYVRERGWLAALLLAAAIAYKVFPATFLILLLAQRRWKLFGLAVMFTAVLTAFASVLFLGLDDGHSLSAFINHYSQGSYQDYMVNQGAGLQHGHTLWGMTRIVGMLSGAKWVAPSGYEKLVYIAIAALVFVLISLHVLFREKEIWKQVLFMTIAAIFLPFVSNDYTMIHMYLPLALFVNSARVSRWNMMYAVLFAVLLVPVDYYYLPGGLGAARDDVSISVLIYPLVLLILALVAVFDQPPRRGLRGPGARIGLKDAAVLHRSEGC
jgi:hypothetical protein